MSSASTPDADSVRQLIERIAATRRFSRSPQQLQFLKFTVDATLHGQSAALKEYYIATEAFGRNPSFDPKSDTIVRVQAGKVRAKLKEYFEAEGNHETIIIDYPVGSYVPIFRNRTGTAVPLAQPERKPWWKARMAIWAVAAATVMLVIVGLRAGWNRVGPPPVNLVQVTFDTGFTSDPSLSRDGKLLAYYSDRAEYGNLDIWVQPADGPGPPRRLTHDSAHDTSPDLSPDGRFVVFRSNREGGGLFVVPTDGGEVRKIVNGGYSPRVSPDSAWIAYSNRTDSGRTAAFIVRADGGEPIELRPESPHTGYPCWSPDGRNVIAVSANTSEETSYDWWVVPVDLRGIPKVSPAIRTGAADALIRQGLGSRDPNFRPSDWYEDSIVFTYPPDTNQSQVWQLPFSPGVLQVAGPARQMLSAPVAVHARVFRQSERPLLLFNSGARLNHIWLLSDSATPAQVTQDTSLLLGLKTRFSLSPDATRLLFPSKRSGKWLIWERDLASAHETAITKGPADSNPLYAPSGQRFAFTREENGVPDLYIQTGTSERKISDSCERPVAWTPNEQAILCTAAKTLSLVETATGRKRQLFQQQGWTFHEAALSPDGKWLAMAVEHGKRQVQGYIAPFYEEVLAHPSKWIRIIEEPFNLTFAWSPDGADLYYFHSRDGFRCLWVERVQELIAGRRAPPPRPVRHFHSFQDFPLNGSAISIAKNRIAVLLAQHRANLWRASLPER
jgi:Tol biopolymer transport system component